MALPAGVITCTVVFNTPVSFAGGTGAATLTVRPTQTIIHQATGIPLGAFTETVAVTGVPGTIALPVVDQSGFVDSSGKAITGWAYTAEISWNVNGQYIASHKSFQLVTGQSSVVLDLIPDGNVSAPVSAPVAPVTSINGATGAVTVTRGSLGLGSVDNTPDASKPVSTAQQAALNAKADASALAAHTGNVSNPHAVTKAQVGLGNADNTADASKPVSTAQQAALDLKQNAADLDAAAAALLNNPASALRGAGNATYASRASNLSDLASAATARTNLGLGDVVTHPASDFSGSAAGTAGKPLSATDATTTNSRTPTAHASTHASGGSDALTLSGAQITTGTVGDARLPVTAQAVTLASTYAPQGKTVYVESFRDGIRTDNQIITAAFAALQAGGALKFGQGVTYAVTTGSAYDLTAKPNVFIDGQGATIDGSAVPSGTILQIKGGSGSVLTTLTSPVVTRSKTLNVASTTGFAAGDMITLRSSGEIFNPDRTTSVKQEVARVASVIDGTTLFLETLTWNAYSLTGYTVNVQKQPAMKNLRVDNLIVKGTGGGSNQTGLQIAYFDGVRLNNILVDGSGVEGLAGACGLDWVATNCRTQNVTATGVGYGFHVTQAHHVKFTNCYGRNNRHSFDVDEVRDVTYEACSAVGDTSAGISTHGSCDTAKFLGNTVKDCGGGMIARGRNTMMIDNTVTGSRTTADSSESYVNGITIGDDGAHTWGVGQAGFNLILKNNVIDMSGPNWTGVDSYGIYCTEALVDAVIEGNKVSGYSAHGIYSKGDYGLRTVIKNNRLDGSGQIGTYGTSLYYGILLSPYHVVAGNTWNEVEIENNRISNSQYAGIRIKGNPDSTGPVSDNITIRNNTIGDCGVARVHLADGYYGSRIEVWGNEWLGIAATATATLLAAAANFLAAPYIGANGWASAGVRPLAIGQELGSRLRPGMYYASPGTTGTAAITQSRLYALPFFVGRQTTADRIGVNVTTAGAAGTTMLLGIYADIQDSSGGYPGSLVAGSSGSVTADTTGFKEAVISAPLTPGLYWLAVVPQGGAPSCTVITGAGSQAVGYQASGAMLGRAAYVQDTVTGALPSSFTTSPNSQGIPPQVQIRLT